MPIVHITANNHAQYLTRSTRSNKRLKAVTLGASTARSGNEFHPYVTNTISIEILVCIDIWVMFEWFVLVSSSYRAIWKTRKSQSWITTLQWIISWHIKRSHLSLLTCKDSRPRCANRSGYPIPDNPLIRLLIRIRTKIESFFARHTVSRYKNSLKFLDNFLNLLTDKQTVAKT